MYSTIQLHTTLYSHIMRVSLYIQRAQEEARALHTQLESAWTEHRRALQQAEVTWAERLTAARSDYDRLKEVSTRRCVELAREVWELKSSLESNSKSHY